MARSKIIAKWKVDKDGRDIEIIIKMGEDYGGKIRFWGECKAFGLAHDGTDLEALRTTMVKAVGAYRAADFDSVLMVQFATEMEEDADNETDRVTNPEAGGSRHQDNFGYKTDLGIRRMLIDPKPISVERDKWRHGRHGAVVTTLSAKSTHASRAESMSLDLREDGGEQMLFPDTPEVQAELQRLLDALAVVAQKFEDKIVAFWQEKGLRLEKPEAKSAN